MAYIEVFPNSAAAQQNLTDNSAAIMDLLQGASKSALNVPDHDIIVVLNSCTAIAFNVSAIREGAVPDVVVKISTSDIELQSQFQNLCDQIVSDWDAQFGSLLKMEVWVSAIEAWGCNVSFD